MSDAMQALGGSGGSSGSSSGRPSRAERTTTSCGECRRRKQKCNQGQPCSNCARRFPQPLCEYKPNSRRPSSTPSVNQPAFAISLLPPSPGLGGRYEIEGTRQPLLPPRQPSPLQRSPWGSTASSTSPGGPGGRSPVLGAEQGDHQAAFGSGVRWSGIELTTQLPLPTTPQPYSWNTTQGGVSPISLVCEEGCMLHSDVVHDAAVLLRAYHSIPTKFLGGNWTPEHHNTWTVSSGLSGLPEGGAGSFDQWPPPGGSGLGMGRTGFSSSLSRPPAPQVIQNTDLLRVFVKLISQFKASIDGNPDASNPYIKYYIPYCVQSPLLVHVGIYTAAGFLNETGHIDRTVAMAHKGYAIGLLNEHMQNKSTSSDECIAGVVQLIVNEWYWGETHDLRAHLGGLSEMIKLRGGFRTLGLHGLISKLAITSDVAIALSFEIPPFLQGGGEFEFNENSQVPLRLALNTPLVSPLAPFASCDEALRIHTATASILDDMRFLISAVLNLPEDATPKQLQKVHSTAAWIHGRMTSLPANGPASRKRQSEDRDITDNSSSTASLVPGAGSSKGTSDLVDEQRQQHWRNRAQQHQPIQFQSPFGIGIPVQSPVEVLNMNQYFQPPHRRDSSPFPPMQAPHSPSIAASSPSMASATGDTAPLSTTTSDQDYVYQSVRLAAILYSRSITSRRPFSQTISTTDFLELWTTAWRVPLVTWRSLLGVFVWLLLPLISTGKSTPHNLYVKSMMNICLFQMGMDNWGVAGIRGGVMGSCLRLQAWLNEGAEKEQEEGRSGSGAGIGEGSREGPGPTGGEEGVSGKKGKGIQREGGDEGLNLKTEPGR